MELGHFEIVVVIVVVVAAAAAVVAAVVAAFGGVIFRAVQKRRFDKIFKTGWSEK